MKIRVLLAVAAAGVLGACSQSPTAAEPNSTPQHSNTSIGSGLRYSNTSIGSGL